MLNTLYSKNNLRLAWQRINTASNHGYKEFFRHAYQCWELGEDQLLRDLRSRLKGTWRPSDPLTIWVPKQNRLHRAISLLSIEDQIVLQALANVCVEKMRKRRCTVEKGHVYSNRINDPNSIFFVQPWYDCYRRFQLACLRHYQAGYRWLLSFDLSAFYDTISHDLLIHTVAPRSHQDPDWMVAKEWLSDWSLSLPGHPAGHGIPQGPLASDVLAELFLLPVDESMIGKGHRYVRYVDDIRVFAKTENAVSRAAIDLEVACRSRGLIPQANKFEIVQAKRMDQVIRVLPSRASGQGGVPLSRSDARIRMKRAVGGRPLRIEDRSALRQVLFAGPPDPRTRDQALKMLPRHPEEIEAFSFYLRQFPGSPPLMRALEALLRSDLPYPYVRARLWELAGIVGGPHPTWMTKLLPLADREWSAATDPSLRWGLCRFFLSCRGQLGRPAIKQRFRSLDPAFQAHLTPQIPASEFNANGLAARLLEGGPATVAMCLAPSLAAQGINHVSLGLQARQLDRGTQHVFRSVGLIKGRPASTTDPVQSILSERFGCPPGCKWKRLLGASYAHSLSILRVSDRAYDSNPSSWLQHLDSFNDVVVRCIIEELMTRGLPGGAKTTIGSSRKLVPYGAFLTGTHPFATGFPSVSGALDRVHQRRNRLPASHAYHLQGGAPNRYLRRAEQHGLCAHMRTALHGIPGIVGFL